MKSWQPYFVVVLSSLHFTSADVITSMNDLESVLKTQETVISDMKDYINKEKLRITQLERTLATYQKEQAIAIEDIPDYLGNPINLYRLIKRLTIDLDTFEETIEIKTKYVRNNTEKHPDLIFPNSVDLIGAAKSMVVLSQTYQLNITDLANGILMDGVHSTPMTSDDCYEMARSLFMEDEYKFALPWFMEALRKNREADQGYNFTESHIIQHIVLCHHYNGDSTSAMEWLLKLLEIDENLKTDVFEEFRHNAKERAKVRLVKLNAAGDRDDVIKANFNKIPIYERLCRGEIQVDRERANRLVCWYSSLHHPFLVLAPIKVEQVYVEPDVFIFHQVISDSEIQHIKNISKAKLKRARVRNGNAWKPTEERTSKVCWLDDNASPTVARITRRVADITGLSMDGAESLQVANYGMGGHYVPHHDFHSQGRRIATILFYMSEVAQGGATVFTELGLSVFPVKNAALYWLNLHPSGEGDLRSLHAACPVLRGNKWSATKWIHFEDQVFTQPYLQFRPV